MRSPAAEPTPSPADIVAGWQHATQTWAQWWMHAITAPGLAEAQAAAPLAAEIAVPAAAAAISADPNAIAALNAKYAAAYEALWNAVRELPTDGRLPSIVEPDAGDRRFVAREWRELAFFSLMKQSYLLASRYLHELATLLPLPDDQRRRLEFATRQYADALAPTNFATTNPEVVKRALETDGASLARGMANLAADVQRGRISMSDASAFAIGRNLAVTPGDVVLRNDLIELIQYAPSTARVHRTPLVVVPPCINKYYILDLQPSNSFVRWAVGEGHTVFIISWRNVPRELGRLAWDDYLEHGVLRAFRVAREISRSAAVNALGFCVGGTLLASALAVLAARGDRSIASATFLTTMLDFAEPGEIGVYVSPEHLAAREPSLAAGERLRGAELAGAFASLRANELVWNYVVRNYLQGETPPAFDLLHWNGDSANLAGPMYAYYLRNMYLDNRLREPGALTMLGERIDLRAVTTPAYVLASRDDHIVPWRSAYRSLALLGGERKTFVLAASGHIAGVVNPPAAQRRSYWTNAGAAEHADAWLAGAQSHAGSWWPHWAAWLAPYAGSTKRAPVRAGSRAHPAIDPAPGRYVVETPDD